ncbi:MAG: hypothetical protein JSV88_33790 [Candidatus Aminicenantes bacterium]|nr:MAG: hypothetical protein JSV88_33790 [Candidatus Aminicenantes bacterium]
MRHFKAISGLVFKRFFSRRFIILLALILVLSVYSTQQGVKEKQKISANMEEFKKASASFFSALKHYKDYSNMGFSILFIPGDASVFFDNPVFLSELTARVNSITLLQIFSNCRGGLVLKGNSPFRPRFSNVVLVLGSLYMILLGFETMKERDFLKLLSSKWSKVLVFISLTFLRPILFILFLLVIFLCCCGLTVLQGISLTAADINGLVIALLPMIIKLLFFFFMGAILGSIRSKYTGILCLLAIWAFFILVYPTAINSYIEEKSREITSSYKVDSDKWKKMTNFENRAKEEHGEYKDNTKEGRRKVAEYFWENDRKDIEAVEEKFKQEMAQLIAKYNKLSLYTPGTFYTYTCSEVSSRGFQSYLEFYTYAQDTKRKFDRFWIDRVYYHDDKVPVNFVTADENLFYSKSRMPENYWTAIRIHLGVIIILMMTSYFLYNRSLVHISTREIEELGEVDMEYDKGDLRVWITIGEHLKKLLYNLFTGKIKGLPKKGFKGEVLVDSVDIARKTNKNDFVYICHPRELPGDMKVRDLLVFYARWTKVPKNELDTILDSEELKPNLNKTIKQLEEHQQFDVVMGILNMSAGYIYLIDNIATNMPMPCSVKIFDKMEELKSNAIVIYLTTPETVGLNSLPPGSLFEEGDSWISMAKCNRRVIKMSIKVSKDKKSEGSVK